MNNNNYYSRLVCRYVIHTVGPRYNIKYKTAAESALFSSYRSVMKIVRFVSLLVFVIFWETAIVHVHVTVRSGRVYPPSKDSINECIIRKLNLLVFVDFRFISAFLYVHWAVNSHIRQLLNFYQLIFLEFDVTVLEGILTFKDFQSDQIQRSSRQILTPHYAWRNAHLNLTLVTGTTIGFIFQVVTSLTESWGYAWPALTGKFFNLDWFSICFVS